MTIFVTVIRTIVGMKKAVNPKIFSSLARLGLAISLAGCGGADPVPPAPPSPYGPMVYFLEPHDLDILTGGIVSVKMGASELTIEPSSNGNGEFRGHFHILDGYCVAPGTHLDHRDDVFDFANGQSEGRIVLTVGLHHLCLQLGTGDHVALRWKNQISIQVRPPM
jgi:uncharacterized protein DUF4399